MTALGVAHAQGVTGPPAWQAGLVLDGAYVSRGLALGLRDSGAGLGHSDLQARGPVGQHLSAEVILGFHTDQSKLEQHLENAWVQTRTLPGGLQLRAGRFASQLGYLNELHPHTDDFSERPLLYRGFFGAHALDDGLRLNWTAPAAVYLRLGAEVFGGKKLVPQARSDSRPGVAVLNIKVGDDLGASSSWQWGLSRVYSRREAQVASHDAGSEHEGHGHTARFGGQRAWVTDLVWKWAPNGNNRQEQVRINWEYARVNAINRYASAGLAHAASSLAATWRLKPTWEVGVRADWLSVNLPEDDAGQIVFWPGRLRENAVMLAYKPSHAQTVRLQLSQQMARGANDAGEPIFANPARRSLLLHYIISFGAHGAHTY